MKYVKKDVEQLIKTNIGVKIRKLKLCGRIDSESTNKILLFFKDNVLNLYVLEYNFIHHNFVSFDKIKIVYGFFNPSGNYIRRRVFYNDKTFKFNVVKRIKFYDYNKSFEYVYYDNDKCNYKVVKKVINLNSIEMPEDLKVYLKLDTEQFLNIL